MSLSCLLQGGIRYMGFFIDLEPFFNWWENGIKCIDFWRFIGDRRNWTRYVLAKEVKENGNSNEARIQVRESFIITEFILTI